MRVVVFVTSSHNERNAKCEC